MTTDSRPENDAADRGPTDAAVGADRASTDAGAPDTPAARRTARAYWTVETARGELRSETLPEVGLGEVLIRTLHSAVSRGTERLVHRGGIPRSEYDRMRAPFQNGDFPHPVKYGYASVGVVEAGPGALVGERVFCLHPHQDRYVVPASAVTVLPADVPVRRATLAANMETAVNVLWDARPCVGDRVAVVGAGVVGCLVAHLAARTAGAEVTLIDANPARADVARALGVPFESRSAPHPDAREDADLVVHATGAPDGLALALSLAGNEATVVEASWYGDRPVPAPLGEAFHSKRLRLVSSQVGALPPHRVRRWDHGRRLLLALRLLREPALDALLTDEHPFDDIVSAMPRVLDDTDTLCATFHYSAAFDSDTPGPCIPSPSATDS